MANRIFYNPEGYIEATIEGDQSYMSFKNLQGDAEDMLKVLQAEGKKRLGLIDLTKMTKFSPDSNRAAMEILESLNYEKIAIFGAGKVLTEVTKAIILAMGKTDETRIFNERKQAIEWLNSEKA